MKSDAHNFGIINSVVLQNRFHLSVKTTIVSKVRSILLFSCTLIIFIVNLHIVHIIYCCKKYHILQAIQVIGGGSVNFYIAGLL